METPAAFEDLLRTDEVISAVSRVWFLDDIGGNIRWNSLAALTNERLIWTEEMHPHTEVRSLELSSITAAADGDDHRYLVRLDHSLIPRFVFKPLHHVLWMRWGNSSTVVQAERTVLSFTRRDGPFARALRDALTARGVEPSRLDLPKRIRKSHGVLLMRKD